MNKKLSMEIVRFAVVGIIATIVDLLVNYVFVFLIPNNVGSDIKSVICTTVGFIAGVIINYILSTIWVFQNVADTKKAKTKGSFFMFVALSAFGLILGIAFMSGFNSITYSTIGIDLYSWQPDSISSIFSNPSLILKNIGFYLFTLFFGLKTLFVLIYNYISRKKIIYIAPSSKEYE